METTASVAGRAMPAAADVLPKATTRLLFVDNIRVFLTILVLLHHLMITYAGTGSWYYTEGKEDLVTGALGAWFQGTNQAYFMGLFLLISAYFVPGSYDRKGAAHFFKDRLIRLGIPLILYSWIVRPILIYFDPINGAGASLAFPDYMGKYFSQSSLIGAGPLWFIETLLIFSLVYVLWRLARPGRPAEPAAETRFPSNGVIALFALLVGLAAFVIRLWLPMMWNFVPLNLQFPFFAQYIALFIVGLIAYRRNWLMRLPETTGRLWLGIGVLTILSFWPMMIGGGAVSGDLTPFFGGWHWQALAYALWESFVCVGMCIGLVYAFRQFANRQGTLAKFLSPNAYTAYLIHGPIIVAVAYVARDIEVYPLLKWVLVALVAVPLCFVLSDLIRKLPYTQRVLG
jgi:glucan biosynthesis protein C